MNYTNKEYAEKAVEANKLGKLLIINNNELEFADIVKTQEDIISENEMEINFLLQEANQKISILQDIIDFEMQESDENEQLIKWKKYRILLTRIDIFAENIELPEKPY